MARGLLSLFFWGMIGWLLCAAGNAQEVLEITLDTPQDELEATPWLLNLPPEKTLAELGLVIDQVDEKKPLPPDTWTWYGSDDKGAQTVHLYFFWNQHCPHCKTAKPFLHDLMQRLDWLTVHSFEVSANQDNLDRFILMAESLDEEPNGVPAFLACQQVVAIGFDTVENSGLPIEEALRACHAQVVQGHPPRFSPKSTQEEEEKDASAPSTDVTAKLSAHPQTLVGTLNVPLLGTIDARQFSLPVYTFIIAGLDAFNPCAFFVLLFLLSLLVHARSRWRMLFIGGVFVFFSGLIYFLFMAAWLNAFRFMGEMKMITLLAAWVAIIVALINIKEFFFFKQGPSLTIPNSAKPGLFQKMRNLLQASGFISLTVGTITLAIAANTYELLCTSGFPMVYTRILTLQELSTSQYYLYLLLYNVIYIVPLLLIVLVFTYTLGARKLQEQEGQALKLLSGFMMLGLGGVLLLVPDLLNNLLTAVIILITAIGLTLLVHLIAIWYHNLILRKPF